MAVDYRLPAGQAGKLPPARKSRPGDGPFHQPHPPYPMFAKQEYVIGDIDIQVTFGADGGPVKTKIIQSSGSTRLDGYTADYMRMYWRSGGKDTVVIDVKIVYRLH